MSAGEQSALTDEQRDSILNDSLDLGQMLDAAFALGRQSALPHLSPRPDAEVHSHAGAWVVGPIMEVESGESSSCLTCGVGVRRDHRGQPWLTSPAPAPVDDREALVSAWDEGRAFGDPYQRRGVPDPADNPYRAGYVKGGR